MITRTTNDDDGTWVEKLTGAGQLVSRQLTVPSAAFLVKMRAAGCEPWPTERERDKQSQAWAVSKKANEDADASDSAVATIKDDVQALKTAVKAMTSGPVTLTKAQTLTLIRGLLYVLKGDKSA